MDIDEFPHLKAWEHTILKRPAVEKGRHVPETHTVKDFKELLKKNTAEAEAEAKAASQWIMQGQAKDAKK